MVADNGNVALLELRERIYNTGSPEIPHDAPPPVLPYQQESVVPQAPPLGALTAHCLLRSLSQVAKFMHCHNGCSGSSNRISCRASNGLGHANHMSPRASPVLLGMAVCDFKLLQTCATASCEIAHKPADFVSLMLPQSSSCTGLHGLP